MLRRAQSNALLARPTWPRCSDGAVPSPFTAHCINLQARCCTTRAACLFSCLMLPSCPWNL